FPMHAANCVVRAREHFAGFFVKQLARVRELHRVGASHKEGHSQFFFEVLYLPAERWLGEVQDLRGPVERSVRGDGDEIAEVTELHCETLLNRKGRASHAIKYRAFLRAVRSNNPRRRIVTNAPGCRIRNPLGSICRLITADSL